MGIAYLYSIQGSRRLLFCLIYSLLSHINKKILYVFILFGLLNTITDLYLIRQKNVLCVPSLKIIIIRKTEIDKINKCDIIYP